MKLSKHYSLKASSIGEAVIAMALIAICLVMATTIYSQVITSGNNLSSFEAEQKLKQLLWETDKDKSFEDEDYDYKTFKISKRVTALDNGNIMEVIFTIVNNEKKQEMTYLLNGK